MAVGAQPTGVTQAPTQEAQGQAAQGMFPQMNLAPLPKIDLMGTTPAQQAMIAQALSDANKLPVNPQDLMTLGMWKTETSAKEREKAEKKARMQKATGPFGTQLEYDPQDPQGAALAAELSQPMKDVKINGETYQMPYMKAADFAADQAKETQRFKNALMIEDKRIAGDISVANLRSSNNLKEIKEQYNYNLMLRGEITPLEEEINGQKVIINYSPELLARRKEIELNNEAKQSMAELKAIQDAALREEKARGLMLDKMKTSAEDYKNGKLYKPATTTELQVFQAEARRYGGDAWEFFIPEMRSLGIKKPLYLMLNSPEQTMDVGVLAEMIEAGLGTKEGASAAEWEKFLQLIKASNPNAPLYRGGVPYKLQPVQAQKSSFENTIGAYYK